MPGPSLDQLDGYLARITAASRPDGKVYDWKHGWIPLTHAAALSKARGNHKLAEKYVPQTKAQKARKTPQHILDYHAARNEQNSRFENHVGGGISAEDTHTQEYKDYFGVGDHSSGGKVEDRITYKEHIRQMSATKQDEAARAKSYNEGAKLGKAHHAANLDTATENAQYDHAAGGVQHPDHFDQGYADGLASAYEKAHQAKARKVAAAAETADRLDVIVAHLAAAGGSHDIAEKGREYWTTGPGGQEIGWGKAPHDFDRCVALVKARTTMPGHEVKGYCARMHKRALGVWPGKEKI